ncbi:DNA repair protein RecO [Flexithrix dorotheae]|uniref:DNA repair protein RecO n=1 Tax=Flexithrix dorotheae TaxID=70993 RepID=UPI000379C6B2|nr:DNA repair protein RecO [Flexithrix dorotheae]
MLFKTRGLVLNFVKYKETSIIARIYTEEFGLKSYIINGVRSKRSKVNKIALYQPLTLLDLVIYNKERRDINRISEAKIHYPYQSIIFDFKKITISIFLTEVLSKTLKEEEKNTALFEFLSTSLQTFDHLPADFENFHLQFMLKLSRYLGFTIDTHHDLTHQRIQHSDHFGSSEIIDQMLQMPYTGKILTNYKTRNLILDKLLGFYQFHFENFKEVKSHEILRELIHQ